ncbi:hypothetical protein, partial [Escherichia coli]|uniref:hypothetical protein n=1 Tax=Escherichia coli TaxID=562 RepID=UPI001BDD870C
HQFKVGFTGVIKRSIVDTTQVNAIDMHDICKRSRVVFVSWWNQLDRPGNRLAIFCEVAKESRS